MNESICQLNFQKDGGFGGGKHLTFSDPGPIPESLLSVPGFVNELAAYTMRTCHSPNRVLAFAGALTCLAHLSGRSCTDEHGTRTNLYIVVLGETGIGKDAPRKVNARLLERVGFEQSMSESFASAEAVEDALAKCPSMLLQADEVAAFFGRMRGGGKSSKAMSERIRRLFTSSSSIYTVRGKANGGGGAQIKFPHLSMFGTGVPDEFLNALTSQEIRDGLFGRCIILCAEDQYVAQSADAHVALPKMVVKTAEALAKRELDAMDSDVIGLIPIKETPEAKELLRQCTDAFMCLRKVLAEKGLANARATVVRVNEKIAKLALLWAVSENPEVPRITRAAVEWAVSLTVYVTKWMLYEGQFHSGEGKFGLLRDRAIASLARHGGSIERRVWLRSLGCDIGTFNRIVHTLIVSEIIDTPENVGGKVMYHLINGSYCGESVK